MPGIDECLLEAMALPGARGAALVDWTSGLALGTAGQSPVGDHETTAAETAELARAAAEYESFACASGGDALPGTAFSAAPGRGTEPPPPGSAASLATPTDAVVSRGAAQPATPTDPASRATDRAIPADRAGLPATPTAPPAIPATQLATPTASPVPSIDPAVLRADLSATPAGPPASPASHLSPPTGPTATPASPPAPPTGPATSRTTHRGTPTGPTRLPAAPTATPTAPTATPASHPAPPTDPAASQATHPATPTAPTATPASHPTPPTAPTASQATHPATPAGPTGLPTAPATHPSSPADPRLPLLAGRAAVAARQVSDFDPPPAAASAQLPPPDVNGQHVTPADPALEPSVSSPVTVREPPVEDVIVTTRTAYHVLRFVGTTFDSSVFLHLWLDRSTGNLALARLRLRELAERLVLV